MKYPRDLEKRDVRLLSFPKVSILISTFNERFVIGRSLEAMEKLDYPKDKIQVVVADDSTDDTIRLIDDKVSELNRLGIDAIVSRRPTRENFKCGALNKAMNYVTGDYILLLDADSIIPPDILSKGIDAMEMHSDAVFRFIPLRSLQPRVQLDYKIVCLGSRHGRHDIKDGCLLGERAILSSRRLHAR